MILIFYLPFSTFFYFIKGVSKRASKTLNKIQHIRKKPSKLGKNLSKMDENPCRKVDKFKDTDSRIFILLWKENVLKCFELKIVQ